MKISFVGTGYVGLVTGAIFADYGYKVHCIDVNEQRIKELNEGKIPFFEPGLEALVKKNVASKNLHFTTDYATAVPDSQAVFICVGTPPLSNGEVDLSQLTSAVEMTAKHLKGYTVIAIKSTVPIGVEVMLGEIIKKHVKQGATYEFASVPEFLSEGTALENTLHPDRLVFGVTSKKAADVLLGIHKHISGERIVTDLRSAQMIKYASNTFLAMKISYANAVANIAERAGANARDVLYGMGLDKRIGHAFFKYGVGFGGSCFPKDVQAFYDVALKNGYDFTLAKATYDTNLQQVTLFLDKIRAAVGGSVENKTIGILGLSFKPDTDDIREAPALRIMKQLVEEGAKLHAYDPVAIPKVQLVPFVHESSQIHFADDAYGVMKDADAMLLVTEWNEFKELDFKKIKQLMKKPVIVDGRSIFDAQALKEMGFSYAQFGNGSKS